METSITHLGARYTSTAICDPTLTDTVLTSNQEDITCLNCLNKLLTSARNYAYECAMSDYSYDSIKSSKAQVTHLETLIRNLGATPPTW